MEGTSSQCRVKFSEHWGESPQFPAPTEMGDDNGQGTGGLREQCEPMTSDEKLLSITSSHREEKKTLAGIQAKMCGVHKAVALSLVNRALRPL